MMRPPRSFTLVAGLGALVLAAACNGSDTTAGADRVDAGNGDASTTSARSFRADAFDNACLQDSDCRIVKQYDDCSTCCSEAAIADTPQTRAALEGLTQACGTSMIQCGAFCPSPAARCKDNVCVAERRPDAG